MNNIVQILFLKVEQSDVQKVTEILHSRPNLVDAEHPKTGQTCLTVATRKNDGQMIEKLIQFQANVNKCNKFHQSPLWIAAFYNFRRAADFLLSRGADINSADKKGFTPLMVAAQRGHLELLALLLNANANVQLLNKNNDSVFDVCKDYETLQFLIQTLQIEEVRVKQPEKFRQRHSNSSQKSTQSKFSNSTPYKHEKSESMPNVDQTTVHQPIYDLIQSLCDELQLIFQEELRKFKGQVLRDYNTIQEAQKQIQQYFIQLQQNTNYCESIQFQYDNFEFEMAQNIGRTIYTILHHVGEDCDKKEPTKSPSPRNKRYRASEPLIEVPAEEEQSTPMSEFRQLLKKVDGRIQDCEMHRSPKSEYLEREQLQQQMAQKLENLHALLNSRISNIKT